MELTEDDFARVADAIRAAEQQTAGEIVCVLARRSSDYSNVPALWAAFVALVSPWPLMLLTQWPVRAIYAAQIGVFILAALVFSWAPLHFALAPGPVKRARAHRAATEQFFTRGVANTPDRSGVLIFVSLAERYARIVVDEGIAQKIGDDQWRAALDQLREQMRQGRIADGFIVAIEECAGLLAKHVPPGGRDELPDRIYVM
jgi:putative membrane protein